MRLGQGRRNRWAAEASAALIAVLLLTVALTASGRPGAHSADPFEPELDEAPADVRVVRVSARHRDDARDRAWAARLLAELFPIGFATLDGSGNNRRHPEWGQADRPYSRVAAARYADGAGAMVGGPSPRLVSNRVFNDVGQNLFSENGVTQWAFSWGQFLDHTFGLRLAGGENSPLTFDTSDALEQFTNDLGVIDFERSLAAPGTGVVSPREQINTVSSYIDAWSVYGGSAERLEWLREGSIDGDVTNNGARLLLSDEDYLPRVGARGDPLAAPEMQLMGRLFGSPERAVVAGDVRANENIALTAIHTLFAREHNRIVDAMPPRFPEQVKFQIARRVVMAEIQYVTYTEFLPALGVELSRYRGYRPSVNATLSNEFAVVGYRAHSMIHGEIEAEAEAGDFSPEELEALEEQGVEIVAEREDVEFVVPLNVAFGNPDLVEAIGLEPLLAGLGTERQYRNDEMIDNQLRSVLFQLPGPDTPDPSDCLDGPPLPDCFQTVLDLGAIDIQRGRDHGIPSYNELRVAYGLAPMTSFVAVTGERTEAFPDDPDVDPSVPGDDPDILDFVSLQDGEGNELEPGSDTAEEGAIVGVRRTTLAARLRALYGDVDALDAFVGMVAEPHVEGSELGELQLAIWTTQFEALRDGDRFFYRNDPSLRSIRRHFGIDFRMPLSKIILLNTDLERGDISTDVFRL